MKTFILGFILYFCTVVLCCYTFFKVNCTDFGVHIVNEDKYEQVVDYSSYTGGLIGSSITICHSDVCPSLKYK